VAKRSAGLLLYRAGADGGVEVLIVHPGGPLWARRDDGAWSIPKGEYPDGADPWDTARREFVEEIGLQPPGGERTELGVVRQAGGKLVTVFAVRGELDVTDARSNTFELEWPPRSGKLREFPEVDRVGWFPVDQARVKLLAGQRPALDRLTSYLGLES
jgi:predicted NUDIX family NTP pyrophosphohydrolase